MLLLLLLLFQILGLKIAWVSAFTTTTTTTSSSGNTNLVNLLKHLKGAMKIECVCVGWSVVFARRARHWVEINI